MSLVSVIMPMRNARPFVADALRSVLAQGGAELEVIVVDDGSTDGSGDIVRAMSDPRLRMVQGPAKGIAAAFNTGLAAARGELLARCDADDYYLNAAVQGFVIIVVGFLQRVVAVWTVDANLELRGLEPGRFGATQLFQQRFAILRQRSSGGQQRSVRRDFLFHRAAEQLVNRLAKRFAFDVP